MVLAIRNWEARMKFFRLYSILAVSLAAPFLLAKGTPCDKRIKDARKSGEAWRQKSRPTSPDYKIEGNSLKTLGFSFELKQAAAFTKDNDGEFYVYLYPSPDKKRGVLSLGSGETRDPSRDLWLVDFAHQKTE